MSIATVSIVGNLVKAPQQIQFATGKVKTTLVVAVNTPHREKRGGDSADFYRVETWGKLAELVATRLDKGNQVTANGRLLMEKWTDDKGRERVTPTISALEIAFPQRPKLGIVSNSEMSASAGEGADDSEFDENEFPDDDDQSSGDGEPDSSTKPAPMRVRRSAPG